MQYHHIITTPKQVISLSKVPAETLTLKIDNSEYLLNPRGAREIINGGHLTNLTSIEICHHESLREINFKLENSKALKYVRISDCGLDSFPMGLPDSVNIVDLSNNPKLTLDDVAASPSASPLGAMTGEPSNIPHFPSEMYKLLIRGPNKCSRIACTEKLKEIWIETDRVVTLVNPTIDCVVTIVMSPTASAPGASRTLSPDVSIDVTTSPIPGDLIVETTTVEKLLEREHRHIKIEYVMGANKERRYADEWSRADLTKLWLDCDYHAHDNGKSLMQFVQRADAFLSGGYPDSYIPDFFKTPEFGETGEKLAADALNRIAVAGADVAGAGITSQRKRAGSRSSSRDRSNSRVGMVGEDTAGQTAGYTAGRATIARMRDLCRQLYIQNPNTPVRSILGKLLTSHTTTRARKVPYGNVLDCVTVDPTCDLRRKKAELEDLGVNSASVDAIVTALLIASDVVGGTTGDTTNANTNTFLDLEPIVHNLPPSEVRTVNIERTPQKYVQPLQEFVDNINTENTPLFFMEKMNDIVVGEEAISTAISTAISDDNRRYR